MVLINYKENQAMKPEFEIGDTVTFKPYEKAFPAKVVGIQSGIYGAGKHIDGSVDSRVFYTLSGDKVASVVSGLSIVESSFYKEWS